MLNNFEGIEYIIGNHFVVEHMHEAPSFTPFADEVLDFFKNLSEILLKTGKQYSDIVTFAFWCRRASLLKMKEEYQSKKLRLGRGIAFHSTPSNVPINFAFSFAASFLAGNKNIVRLPAKNFPQVEIICDAVNAVLEKQVTLKPYIVFLRYKSSREISDYFSALCSVRLIWGGDQTIENMRKSSLSSRAKDLTFADRYSILILNAEEVLKSENDKKLLQDFYNDSYFFDQNACTSPRLVVWYGQHIDKAKKIFWKNVHDFVSDKYVLHSVQSVGKLSAFYRVSAVKPVRLENDIDQLITRIKVNVLTSDLLDYKYNSGFFFEYDAQNLKELLPIFTKKCQTLAYYGFDRQELTDFVQTYKPEGIDRIVPIGTTMNFSLFWDGYDLIVELSRIIEVN